MNKIKLFNYFPESLYLRNSPPQTIKIGESILLLYHSFSELARRFYFNTSSYVKFYSDIIKLKEAGFIFSNNLVNLKPRHNTVAITFDDSYQSVFPVLEFCENNKIPVTLFVNSLSLEDKNLLPKDKIVQACRHAKKGEQIKFLNNDIILKNSSLFYRDHLAMNFNRQALAELSYSDYEIFAENFLISIVGKDYTIDDDLRQMSKETLDIVKSYSYCQIGCHGRNHYDLRRLNNNALISELADSKSKLEMLVGRNIETLSFPYGFYDTKTVEAAKLVGFQKVITVIEKPLTEFDLYELPRIGVDMRVLNIL